MAILEAIDQEKREVKQCFSCGGIEPINEYQKNGKTPRGRQKYRQDCRECREDQEKIKKDREIKALNEGTRLIREQTETMRGLYNALKPGKKKG